MDRTTEIYSRLQELFKEEAALNRLTYFSQRGERIRKEIHDLHDELFAIVAAEPECPFK